MDSMCEMPKQDAQPNAYAPIQASGPPLGPVKAAMMRAPDQTPCVLVHCGVQFERLSLALSPARGCDPLPTADESPPDGRRDRGCE
jgi:hypothetical protein